MFFETVDLGLSADDPVVVHYHTVGALFFPRKQPISFLEVVHATQISVTTTAASTS